MTETEQSYFRNPLAEFIHQRTYAKFRYDLGRRETWTETVQRVMDFFREIGGSAIPEDDYEKLHASFKSLNVVPSMRLVSMAGEAARRQPLCCFNCSALDISSIDSFAEILYLLSQGCGVGFGVEHVAVSQLPTAYIASDAEENPGTVVVEDSSEGWADAFREVIRLAYEGRRASVDLSSVRPAGSPLKTKGGRSSGPLPLLELVTFTQEIILRAAKENRQLTTLEAHDIATKIGTVIVVGGVRRSAEISISDLDDEALRFAKSGPFWEYAPWRAMANNSGAYNERPSPEMFWKEWNALAASGTGERGIFNRYSITASRPARRQEARFLVNPCFAPGTMVQTSQGHFLIEDLVGKTVKIWNGKQWQSVDNFRVTAENQPVLKITYHDGSSERVTPYHTVVLDTGKKIQAKDLEPGKRISFSQAPLSHGTMHETGAYLKGFLTGDGTLMDDKAVLYLYSPKYECQQRLIDSASEVPSGPLRTNAVATLDFIDSEYNERKTMRGLGPRKGELSPWSSAFKRSLPVKAFEWDYESKCSFIAGVMDADGTASDGANGFLYQITSIHRRWLLDFQLLLKTIGVASRISTAGVGGKRDFNDGYGEYETKPTWRLTISQQGAITLSQQVTFDRLESFADRRMSYKLKPRYNKVVSVEPDGVERFVYCCTVDDSHTLGLSSGLLYGQCGEAVLRSDGGLCNLSEAVVRAEDTLDDLSEKVRLAAIFGTLQSCLVDFPFVRESWRVNARQERLLGVSLTGQLDHKELRVSPGWFSHLKNIVIETNAEYAGRLGINQSVATTLSKPSGTVSQLVDCSSGVHARWSPYYIRRVRITAHDPLCSLLRTVGAPMQPEFGQTAENATTWVVEFPVKSPDGALCRKDITAQQQLDYVLMVQKNWAEHATSATLYIAPDEWTTIGQAVLDSFDDIAGLSFLPRDDALYPLAPYEQIDADTYQRLVSEFPRIPYEDLHLLESEDNTEGSQTIACLGPSCEL